MPASSLLPQKIPGHLCTVDLHAVPESVSSAREFTRDALERAGIGAQEIDDLEVIVSELVTNSVRHSASALPGGKVTLVIFHDVIREFVHIDVLDAGGDPIAHVPDDPVDPEELSGRGLFIVRTLATTWGIYEDVAGRAIWIELDVRRGAHRRVA